MNRRMLIGAGVFLLSILLPSTFMGGPLSADEIMDRVRENRYPDTSQAVITMTLIEPSGKSFIKKFTMWRKVQGASAKTLIVFQFPPEIKGTSFLVLQEGDKEDTFAKFTEVPTIQRISESQNSDRFMGSDFTYGDFRIDRKGEDNYKLTGEETVDGRACFVIQSTPRDIKKAQYAKVIIWVDKERFSPLKTDFYEKKRNEKVKTLEVKKIELIEKTWTPTSSTMIDLKNRHQTKMELSEIKFRIALKDDMFTPRTLLRGL